MVTRVQKIKRGSEGMGQGARDRVMQSEPNTEETLEIEWSQESEKIRAHKCTSSDCEYLGA